MSMQTKGSKYAIRRTVDMPYDEAVSRVREMLKEQGFGVLTEIDVKKTVKEKLGEDFAPYIILGACNPKLAHKALSEEPSLGVLLPCNVIVYEREGTTFVEAVDPIPVLGLVENPQLEPIAADVRARLERALENL